MAQDDVLSWLPELDLGSVVLGTGGPAQPCASWMRFPLKSSMTELRGFRA